MSIYVTRPSLPDIQAYIEEIRPIFETHILTNAGPVYKKFQQQLRNYLQVPYLSLFVNGHMALEMSIQAMGLRQKGEELGGGEVITTPFTFVSTTHAITRNNLKPVFCDINRTNYCIDPDKIEDLITDKTVAIIPVHVYGKICDVERIEAIAKKHNLRVIYDGAHAFGESCQGIGIGNFGDATMFSFHATKVFNSIEGGAVAFNDERYETPLNDLKDFGIHGPEEIVSIGGNAKLDEFRAAMGLCNLRRMEQCVKARQAVHDRYFERLSGVEGVSLCPTQEDVEPNYAYFPVYFDRKKFGRSRDDVFVALGEQDIHARKYFYPAINDLTCYREYAAQKTPVAHDVSLNILTLPIYEGLALSDVDRICDVILG